MLKVIIPSVTRRLAIIIGLAFLIIITLTIHNEQANNKKAHFEMNSGDNHASNDGDEKNDDDNGDDDQVRFIKNVKNKKNSNTDDLEKETINNQKNNSLDFSLNQHNIPRLPKRDYPDKNLLVQANEGMGYYVDPSTQLDKVRVVLWGKHWLSQNNLALSGCPIIKEKKRVCPYHPNCNIYYSESEHDLRVANVVLIPITESIPNHHDLIFSKHYPNMKYRVVYRREAFWEIAMSKKELKQRYDFEMSFSLHSGIMNPIFARTPMEIFGKMEKNHKMPFESKHFAMSLISDCRTLSKREKYIQRMISVLGKNKLHEYGDCGDGTHVLPRHSFAKVSEYKFYLSFENTIVDGYVTEKLYDRLRYGPIPVYYGAPDVMNITKKISFINANNFKSPEALAKYLLFLDGHPKEYMKYHEWRENPKNAFDETFLRLIALQKPGALEMNVTEARLYPKVIIGPNRRAACCRLCNLKFVEQRKQSFNWSHVTAPKPGKYIDFHYLNLK